MLEFVVIHVDEFRLFLFGLGMGIIIALFEDEGIGLGSHFS